MIPDVQLKQLRRHQLVPRGVLVNGKTNICVDPDARAIEFHAWRQEDAAGPAVRCVGECAAVAPAVRPDNLTQRSDFDFANFPGVVVESESGVNFTPGNVSAVMEYRKVSIGIGKPVPVAVRDFSKVIGA